MGRVGLFFLVVSPFWLSRAFGVLCVCRLLHIQMNQRTGPMILESVMWGNVQDEIHNFTF